LSGGQAGGRELLRAIATAHARLALAGRNAEAIVAAAATAAHRQDFEAQLVCLAAGMERGENPGGADERDRRPDRGSR
jgi:hypothetical protein